MGALVISPVLAQTFIGAGSKDWTSLVPGKTKAEGRRNPSADIPGGIEKAWVEGYVASFAW